MAKHKYLLWFELQSWYMIQKLKKISYADQGEPLENCVQSARFKPKNISMFGSWKIKWSKTEKLNLTSDVKTLNIFQVDPKKLFLVELKCDAFDEQKCDAHWTFWGSCKESPPIFDNQSLQVLQVVKKMVDGATLQNGQPREARSVPEFAWICFEFFKSLAVTEFFGSSGKEETAVLCSVYRILN